MTNSVRSLQVIILSLAVSRISGRGTWNASDGNYEYYVSSSGVSKSYNDSLDECKKMDGELAMVKSAETQNFLNSLYGLEGLRPYAFYIGLQESTDGSYVWDDGDTLDYKHWKDHEPNSPGIETCVIAGNPYSKESDLKWRDAACVPATKIGFFCQRLIGKIWSEWGSWSECFCPSWQRRERNCTDTGRPGKDSCVGSGELATENRTCWSPECNVTTIAVTTTPRPLGRGHWFPNGGFEYYVSPAGEGVSYQESQENCQAKAGELALVKSVDVHTFIASLVSDNSGHPYAFYIGLKHDSGEDGFLWTDGSPMTYDNWHSGEPNRLKNPGEDCVGMGHNYEYQEDLQWYDYDCITGTTGKKGSVCQRRIGTYWGEWSVWSSCNCSITSQSRKRTCLDSMRDGPNGCTGSDNETQTCPEDPSCYTTTAPPYEDVTTITEGSTAASSRETSTKSIAVIDIVTSTPSAIVFLADTGSGAPSSLLVTASTTTSMADERTATSSASGGVADIPTTSEVSTSRGNTMRTLETTTTLYKDTETITTENTMEVTTENTAVSHQINNQTTDIIKSTVKTVTSKPASPSPHTTLPVEMISTDGSTSSIQTVTPSSHTVTTFSSPSETLVTTESDNWMQNASTPELMQSTTVVDEYTPTAAQNSTISIVIGVVLGFLILVIIVISLWKGWKHRRTTGRMTVSEYGVELGRRVSDRRSLTEEERLQIIMDNFPGGAEDGIGYGHVKGRVNQTFFVSDEDPAYDSNEDERDTLQNTDESALSGDLISFESMGTSTHNVGSAKTGLEERDHVKINDDVYAVVNKKGKSIRKSSDTEKS